MPASVPPAPSRPGEAQTSGCTTVATVALLLLATGSAVVELTVALFVRVPALVGVLTEMATVRRLPRSEEHTSELHSPCNLVCRLLLEKKKTTALSILC